MIWNIRTDAGQELNAKASLSQTADGFQLTFESSGESGRRNGDYKEAFALALQRLRSLAAVLKDGRVESRITRGWDPQQKRLVLRGWPYPIELTRVDDIVRFATELRAAGAKVGHTGRGPGNPTKRIALDFALPPTFDGGLQRVGEEVFGTKPRAAQIEDSALRPPVNDWWAGLPEERYWLEITDRSDLGIDLRAPLVGEDGKPTWSYSLARWVNPGDVVFHYHKEEQAIVGRSRATATQWTDEIVWGARGTSARDSDVKPHPRPGWYVALEDFKRLKEPVTLENIRASRSELKFADEQLKRSVRGAVYFPFELAPTRPVRPAQGYLVKMPRRVVELFPALSLDTQGHAPIPDTLRPTFVPGVYRRANEECSVAASDPYAVDPALKERSLKGHAVTQNALADHLQSRHITPLSPDGEQPNFDIAWQDGDILWVAEVKSLTDANEEKQLRLGLGQVLRYRQIMSGIRPARAALITERQPRDRSWIALCREVGVVLAWPANWDVLHN